MSLSDANKLKSACPETTSGIIIDEDTYFYHSARGYKNDAKTIYYTYSVNDKEYRGEQEYIWAFFWEEPTEKAGDPIKIHYNPKRPSEHYAGNSCKAVEDARTVIVLDSIGILIYVIAMFLVFKREYALRNFAQSVKDLFNN